jgi:hypothetical protein
MPTGLRIGPYRFHFDANDRREPPHVDVERDDATAKFWISPVRFQSGRGVRRREISRLQTRVEVHRERLVMSWNEYFTS